MRCLLLHRSSGLLVGGSKPCCSQEQGRGGELRMQRSAVAFVLCADTSPLASLPVVPSPKLLLVSREKKLISSKKWEEVTAAWCGGSRWGGGVGVGVFSR